MSERDPRPCDIWRKGKRTRHVVAIGPFVKPGVIGVHFITGNKPRGNVLTWEVMSQWRKWAANATVERKGEG